MAYKKLKATDARKIALEGFKVLTLYRNEFPYNCGLKINNAVYGDCWCFFPKTLIWSHACGIDPFIGRKGHTFFYNGQGGNYPGIGACTSYDGIGKSGLGDWDGDTIMSTCADVRSDFRHKEVAELMLISGHHMAMHIGDFQLKGKTCNSVEFNYFNDELQGLLAFWTDENGYRYWYKGGSSMGGKFDLIGKLAKWIDYSQPKQLTIDGVWGKTTTDFAQKVYGCKTVNGKVVHQKKSYKKVCPACTTDSWKFDGTKGYSPLIAKIQKELKLGFKSTHPSYGKFTRKTRRSLQKFLGVKVDGNIGSETVKAFQKYLNKKVLSGK